VSDDAVPRLAKAFSKDAVQRLPIRCPTARDGGESGAEPGHLIVEELVDLGNARSG
jgi:hypothetical protein